MMDGSAPVEPALLLDATDQALFAVDTAGRCTYVNRAAADLFGYAPAELLGQNVHALAHARRADGTSYPEDACPVYRAIREERGFRQDDEVVWRRDGTAFPAEYSAHPIVDRGQVVGAVVAVADISARRHAEAERAHLLLREQAARADADRGRQNAAFLAEASQLLASSLDYEATLANVARLAVPRLCDWCVVDQWEDGEIRLVALAHVDPAKEDLVRELRRRYPPNPHAPYGLARVLREGEPQLYPHIDATWREAAARDTEHLRLMQALGAKSSLCVPLRAREQILGAVTLVCAESARAFDAEDLAVAEDLAARCALALDNARLHGQLEQALRSRDEFLAHASHDLRNPLSSIMGQAQLLLRRAERPEGLAPDQLADGLRRLRGAADRMAAMLDELLDLSRVQMARPLGLRPEPLDLVQLASQAAEEYQTTTEQHRLVLHTEEVALVGQWDRVRLGRVLGNLLSNAIKYSPDGGDIEVRLRREADGERAWAALRVRDRGLGIPAGDLPRLFERFHRGSNVAGLPGGTGLGLAGSKKIVDEHGGSLTVESQEGVGTTFTVRLPLSAD